MKAKFFRFNSTLHQWQYFASLRAELFQYSILPLLNWTNFGLFLIAASHDALYTVMNSQAYFSLNDNWAVHVSFIWCAHSVAFQQLPHEPY